MDILMVNNQTFWWKSAEFVEVIIHSFIELSEAQLLSL